MPIGPVDSDGRAVYPSHLCEPGQQEIPNLMRTFLVILVLLLLGVGAAWFIAGNADGPSIEIVKPAKAIGQVGQLEVVVDAPAGRLTRLDVAVEQNGSASRSSRS